MTADALVSERLRASDLLVLCARCVLGALFIYMGLNKALHSVEFLKLVRQYGVLHQPFWLNLVASALPWFEVFCGLLLVLGIAVRGTAVMLLTMLVFFTALVFLRALEIYKAGGQPFCSIKFDCGCGAGEVFICRKLAENLLLAGLAVGLVFWHRNRFSLRYSLFSRAV